MGRRIWVISEKKKITNKIRAEAKLNNCPEIAVGIPLALIGRVGNLPCVVEEIVEQANVIDWDELWKAATTTEARLEVVAQRLGLSNGQPIKDNP